jgi:hypothetical protein
VLETGIKQPEAIGLYTSAGYADIPEFGLHEDLPEILCLGKELG